MKSKSVIKWLLAVGLACFILVFFPTWLVEVVGLRDAIKMGDLEAYPLEFASSLSVALLWPCAIVGLVSVALHRTAVLSAAIAATFAFMIILSAQIAPRHWRTKSFPAQSDNDAWVNARKQVAAGNKTVWEGIYNGKIIWVVKGPGASVEQILYSLFCGVPGFLLICEAKIMRMQRFKVSDRPNHG